jgi:homoserine O-acetyltransferase/O-succinyltransferase
MTGSMRCLIRLVGLPLIVATIGLMSIAANAGVGVVEKRVFLLPAYTTVGGDTIREVRVGYETYGKLNARGDNAIFVAHFFTGTSHAAGRYRPQDKRVGYWDAIIGPGRAIDTDRYFVISADTLVNVTRGVSAITTGPSSLSPETGRPYGASFPLLRPRDFVRVHRSLVDALGVTKLQMVIGASAGAIQAMEWAAAFPEMVERVGHVTGPGLALQQTLARLFDIWMRPLPARRSDEVSKHQAFGSRMPDIASLAAARSDPMGEQGRFIRAQADRTPVDIIPNLLSIEELLKRSGIAGAMAFDVSALAWAARAYQLYDLEAEATRIKARVLFVPAKGDRLFPPSMSRSAADRLRAQGNVVELVELDGPNGHHEGVVGIAQAGEAMRAFLAR